MAEDDGAWPDDWADDEELGEAPEDGAEGGDDMVEVEAPEEADAQEPGWADEGAEQAEAVEYSEEAVEDGAAEVGAEEEAAEAEQFRGLVIQVGAKTGNMLIKCFRVMELYQQEAVILKGEYGDVQLGDKVAFQVVPREAQRPLATGVRVVGHVDPAEIRDARAQGGSRGNAGQGTHGKGQDGRGYAGPAMDGKGKGKGRPVRDTFYAGVLKPSTQPLKGYYICCREIEELFGMSAWFPAYEKPNVQPGGLVTFTVSPKSEAGAAPRALRVARLEASPAIFQRQALGKGAGAGMGGRAAGKGGGKGGANGTAVAGPRVQKTIAKTI